MITRRQVFAVGLTATLAVLAILFTWSPYLASAADDSANYLLMARYFAALGQVSPALAAEFAAQKYLPLLPALLALTGAAENLWRAHTIVAICFALSVPVFGVWAAHLTQSRKIGWGLALIYAALPGSWLNVLGILSEFPYLLLTFAVLLAAQRPPTLRNALLLGGLFSLALLTRPNAVVLLAAWLLATALQRPRRWRPALTTLLVALLPLIVWNLWHPPVQNDNYAQHATQALLAQPQFLMVVAASLEALLDAWSTTFILYWFSDFGPSRLVTLLLGGCALAGCLQRCRLNQMDGYYVAASLLMLVIWPYPGQHYRLLFPIVPLLLLQAVWWAQQVILPHLPTPLTHHRLAPATLLAITALFLLSPALFMLQRAQYRTADGGSAHAHNLHFYLIPDFKQALAESERHLQFFADLERLRQHTPPQARIASVAPLYVTLLSDRQGVALQEPISAETLRKDAHRADFLLLTELHPRDSANRGGNRMQWMSATPGTLIWLRQSPNQQAAAALFKRALSEE